MTAALAQHASLHPTVKEFIAVIFFALGYIANHIVEHRR